MFKFVLTNISKKLLYIYFFSYQIALLLDGGLMHLYYYQLFFKRLAFINNIYNINLLFYAFLVFNFYNFYLVYILMRGKLKKLSYINIFISLILQDLIIYFHFDNYYLIK